MAGLDPRQMRALQQMFAQQADKKDGLVSFRAGMLFLDESTRMVTADKKRGKVKCIKDESGLLHFQWLNRISSQKELDLTIFPGAAKWERVSECTDGRVYLLRLSGTNRKHFFWMQEPEADKDDEYAANINKLCNGESLSDGAAAGAAGSGSGGANTAGAGAGALGAGGGDLAQQILNALQAQGTGGAGSGAQGAATQSPAGGGNNLMAQMANMLRQNQQAAMEELKREPDLEDIVDASANAEIGALLDDEKVVAELAEHLPEGMRSREAMLEQLQSPQFQGALRRLQSAVNGPQMPVLLQQMGVAPPAGNAMGTTAFCEAIAAAQSQNADKDKNQDGGDKEKDADGDSEMSGDT